MLNIKMKYFLLPYYLRIIIISRKPVFQTFLLINLFTSNGVEMKTFEIDDFFIPLKQTLNTCISPYFFYFLSFFIEIE